MGSAAVGTLAIGESPAEASSSVSVSVAYADTLRSGGTLPSPWQGSANVNFGGGGSPYDAGAVEISNPGSVAVTVDDVKIIIGSNTYDLWGSALSAPAGGSLILTQTVGDPTYNFDTSDTPVSA